ncbi:MAG: site-specific integrase, partial [Parachlamydiaceae bacterium]
CQSCYFIFLTQNPLSSGDHGHLKVLPSFEPCPKDGKSFTWRAVVRIKGFPTASKSFERKQEAEDWGQETERGIKQGQFKFAMHKKQHTYAELIDRLHSDGALEHHRSFKKVRSQYEYWQRRIGTYALVHITSELISKERQLLMEGLTPKGTKRSAGTINRYMTVLSSTFNHAVKRLRWLHENPCASLLKLKDDAKRDETLKIEDFARLFDAIRESKSHYLYCIVLIALTTGARQGEILGLEWSHIDFENKLAHLTKTKNSHPRSVALVEPVIVELKKLYDSRKLNKPLVFASHTAFGKIDIKKSWRAALKKANISLTFHGLRHSFCTMAAQQGASNLELASAMGHRTLQMLLRYTHLEANLTRKYSEGITKSINAEVL